MKRTKELFIIGTCLLMWAVLFGGWTDTLKTNTPAYDDNPQEADDRIRELKAAFVERLDIDHYFEASATSTYDAADCGKHRYVTFREPNDLTTMSADESAIFSKDANSLTELHWIDESDNVLQLTDGGTINIVSADLLGTLASDTYFTDANSVDLIKGDPNGDAVLPDGAELATSAAPTTDQAIANKKYVVDSVGTWDPNIATGITGTNDSIGTVTFPNGLIQKWGKLNLTASADTTVTFATAFPNACFQAFADYGNTGATCQIRSLRIHTITAASFKIRSPCGDAGAIGRWFAIGR